ncbi:hypothetical protein CAUPRSCDRAFT_13259 [Caulochytrium protostelioides]|uniref:Uncharacterized protein n=1 Tax=Caulochytrium protostelioides TaxID=1555241 RepID=A0A4P9WQN8_9FUNG|nr:hypothetical protein CAUPRSCDRAFT_13259 [Caulochytrium protostelioides]
MAVSPKYAFARRVCLVLALLCSVVLVGHAAPPPMPMKGMMESAMRAFGVDSMVSGSEEAAGMAASAVAGSSGNIAAPSGVESFVPPRLQKAMTAPATLAGTGALPAPVGAAKSVTDDAAAASTTEGTNSLALLLHSEQPESGLSVQQSRRIIALEQQLKDSSFPLYSGPFNRLPIEDTPFDLMPKVYPSRLLAQYLVSQAWGASFQIKSAAAFLYK